MVLLIPDVSENGTAFIFKEQTVLEERYVVLTLEYEGEYTV